MQRLPVLILALALALPAAAAPAPQPGSAAEAKAALEAAIKQGAVPDPNAAPKPKALEIGQTLDFRDELKQVWPMTGSATLMPRNGRPLAVFFWGINTTSSKDDLLVFDEFVRKNDLLKKMDVYAVASFKSDKAKPDDAREAAILTGIQTVPVVCDPDFLLSGRLGASLFPEIALFDKDGRFLVKGLRGLDHGNLSGSANNAAALIQWLADKGTAELVPRTFPFYASERLKGRLAPDFELPRFSPDGFGKGKLERFGALRSGSRPTVLMFFSSTCTHCQIDVPQIVKFLKANPNRFEVIGVTRIKNDQHRQVSEQYFKQQGIEFPVLEDMGAVSDLYQVTSTPTAYYLSPEGTVVSISYYQHDDLSADWLKLEPKLLAAPPALPAVRPTAWKFPVKVKDAQGKELDLSTLAGKPTVVHFWATWCGPCRAELPELVARIPEMKKTANVLMVSVETDAEAIAKYEKTTGLRLDSYLAPTGPLAEKVNFGRSVPRTYVLDPFGKVVFQQAGSLKWAEANEFSKISGRLLR